MRITRRVFLGAAGLSAVAGAVTHRNSVLARDHESTAPSAPGQGRRWAMVVDVGKCLRAEGCTKCTAACNEAHNIPAIGDRAHEVKWIWKERFDETFREAVGSYANEALGAQPTVVLCNHCDNPPCTRVCPTEATWKREDGIVMMDWHRCIGCRYCAAACPYGSRSFNWQDPRPRIARLNPDFPTRTKGVVEKCNFCEERLAIGRPPACVDVCPEHAMVFGDLHEPTSSVRQILANRFAIRRKMELGTGPAVYYVV